MQKTITSNLRSNISLIQSFLPLLSSSPRDTNPLQSRIIILSSFISYTPLPGLALPSATASALDSLARALMVECQGRNVRTTIVRTGFIRGSVPRIADDTKDGMVKTWRRIIWWADRIGTPVEYVAKQVTDALVRLPSPTYIHHPLKRKGTDRPLDATMLHPRMRCAPRAGAQGFCTRADI
jgi:NAD(P)-dependent dehydrogenase (short-subunit alcohol dehydrogenase family)